MQFVEMLDDESKKLFSTLLITFSSAAESDSTQ